MAIWFPHGRPTTAHNIDSTVPIRCHPLSRNVRMGAPQHDKSFPVSTVTPSGIDKTDRSGT